MKNTNKRKQTQKQQAKNNWTNQNKPIFVSSFIFNQIGFLDPKDVAGACKVSELSVDCFKSIIQEHKRFRQNSLCSK